MAAETSRTRKGGHVALRHDMHVYGNYYAAGFIFEVLAQRGDRICILDRTLHGAWVNARHLSNAKARSKVSSVRETL